mmetsp:Transcript_9047/g.26373  ORF Transcript_9047/g.26373 Transcript_9047/m.26373 type:complete len:209 (+) Transcript_9047:174-800(+)
MCPETLRQRHQAATNTSHHPRRRLVAARLRLLRPELPARRAVIGAALRSDGDPHAALPQPRLEGVDRSPCRALVPRGEARRRSASAVVVRDQVDQHARAAARPARVEAGRLDGAQEGGQLVRLGQPVVDAAQQDVLDDESPPPRGQRRERRAQPLPQRLWLVDGGRDEPAAEGGVGGVQRPRERGRRRCFLLPDAEQRAKGSGGRRHR